ncbi:MAG: PRC and DUF2382 domain-containing protein [bacterium]
MTAAMDPQSLIGRNVVGSDGDKIGKIGQVYLNDQSGEPEWVTVSTGLFGTKESFVPLQGASATGDDIAVSVSKDVVKGAPNVDSDGHTDEGEQQALYDYYAGHLGSSGYASSAGSAGYTTGSADGGADLGADGGADGGADYERGTVGHDTSGPTTDDAMTRSEERLRVGTEQVEAGRARLRKYIVTENVTQTVPVSREEVRIEREPITDANIGDATAGPDLSEEEHEVTLRAERPVVDKETVPVERVRLDKETVTEQEQVSEEVRREQIDTPDLDTNTRTDR